MWLSPGNGAHILRAPWSKIWLHREGRSRRRSEEILPHPFQLFLSNLRISPRNVCTVRSHDVRISTFAGYEDNISRLGQTESFSHGFSAIDYDFRFLRSNTGCYFNNDLFWVFVIWIFVGQNDGFAIFICNFPHLRAFPRISASTGSSHDTNFPFIGKCLIQLFQRIRRVCVIYYYIKWLADINFFNSAGNFRKVLYGGRYDLIAHTLALCYGYGCKDIIKIKQSRQRRSGPLAG